MEEMKERLVEAVRRGDIDAVNALLEEEKIGRRISSGSSIQIEGNSEVLNYKDETQGEDRDYGEEIEIEISNSLELVEIQRKSYQSVINGGILLDHFMSLKHGLRLLQRFWGFDGDESLTQLLNLVSHVKQKLYFLSYLRNDESLVMKLDHEYSYLRKEMKNVILYLLFPESFNNYVCESTSVLLGEIMEELVSSDCKADQIRPVKKELEDIWKMLSLLEPFFPYEKHARHFRYDERWDKPFAGHEKEKKILSRVVAAMDIVTCFVYVSAVGKMDDEMEFILKNMSSESDLIIEETEIMEMYLSLDVDSTENLESHISMSLRLLGWNKRCYLGTELGETLEDNFTSIKVGLQYLVEILKVCNNEDFKLRVLHLIKFVKQKLYSLPHNQNNENLKVNLEHAYGELREEMKNVVIKPGTDDYDTLFPEVLMSKKIVLLEELTSLKLTSSSKGDQIAPMMKEIKELGKKLKSLKPLFNDARIKFHSLFRFTRGSKEVKVNVALRAFFDRATCLIYLSLVAKLNEDEFVSLRNNFSLLIEETEIKKMSLDLGIIFEDDLESDIDISLSLLKRHQECHKYTINEAIFEDHVISLKYGIEFLKWIFNIYNFDKELKRCIILLARNVKQKLEWLTYKQEDESLNVDVNAVNDAYVDLRKQMKNVVISHGAAKYGSLSPELISYYDFSLENIMKSYLRRNYDFLVEKITTLVTSDCKADRIAPLKKEIQDLRERLNSFKPLGLYICGIPELRDEKQILKTLLTFLHKATFLIYLTFVATMDIEMVHLVKSSISIAIKETDDVREIYTLVLNQFLSESHYKVTELYLLENMMILSENHGESLDGEMLHKVLEDIHSFLLALPPNVILKKLLILKESFEGILRHAIPIVYSCYLEPTEVDISAEFNYVLDLIKHIKSEAVEMKLYYFPRVDDLGFLKFLLGYLEDKMKNQEILLKEQIDALHVEVNTLLSLAKTINEELDENLWNDIMNLAYQAEYIIDLYLVSSPRDSGLISSLSKIIDQLHNIRADVTWDLSHLCKSLPAQDVAAETSKPQARDNVEIVSLQEETINIMDDLLKGEKKLNVVAITGMAGVGKTTLALTLYNDPSTARWFPSRAWCVVSQSYQLRALLVSILDQVNAVKSYTSISDNEGLGCHLFKRLKKQRYLVILDDVWDTNLWKDLKHFLPEDLNGSRILITTRNRDVADQIGSKVNELHGLSEENSWKLFQTKMLDNERLSDDLLNISKGIVKNCKGLPLSIVVVAGILSGIERTQEKWDQIAKSVNSFVLSDPQGNCRAILELSYKNLPNHLRSCFVYLGSFPEDQEISVNRLILLWIGEGFVQDIERDTPEEVAEKYMDELISKSLVIPAKKRSRGGVKTFRLHDLLRDFCLGKAKEKHFFSLLSLDIAKEERLFSLLGDEAFDERNHPLALPDPRRIIMNGSYGMRNKIVDFSCHSVRSMIWHGQPDAFEIKKRIGSCDMVLLRVLEVDEVCLNLFPAHDECSDDFSVDISSLVHLRYLSFCYKYEQKSFLLSTISRLQNLQILILEFDSFKVPDFIWDMVKLSHIHIDDASFEVDSNRLLNSSVLLENLKSLSKARVSNGDSKWLSKLLGLEKLSCLLEEEYNLKEEDGPEENDDDPEEDDYLEEEDDLEVDDVTEVDDDLEEENGPKWLSKLSGLRRLCCLFMTDDLEDEDITEANDDIEVDDVIEMNDDTEVDDVTEVEDTEMDDDTEVDHDRKMDDAMEVDDDVKDDQSRMLSFNETLISLKVENYTYHVQRFTSRCQLPESLRKLTLSNFYLESNDFSIIGKAVPHLEVFKIYSCSVPSGYEWNVDDEDFPELKVLKLKDLKISKWTVSEDSFPNLEQLWVEKCDSLDEIPLEFGSLQKLRIISVKDCPPSVDDSVREIEKEQHEQQNTEMRVHISKPYSMSTEEL